MCDNVLLPQRYFSHVCLASARQCVRVEEQEARQEQSETRSSLRPCGVLREHENLALVHVH